MSAGSRKMVSGTMCMVRAKVFLTSDQFFFKECMYPYSFLFICSLLGAQPVKKLDGII